MGAWGAGNFENDDAADWLYDLYDSEGDELLVETFKTITEEDDPEEELEAPDCCCALAAAEIVAAAGGKPTPGIPDEANEWLGSHPIKADESLVALAKAAIERIRSDSELKDLWEEVDSGPEWHRVVQDLLARLNAAK